MKSKSSFIAFSLLGALFLLPYCDDDTPEDVGFRYPLAVGNTWEYTHKSETYYYSDSTASTYDDTTTMLLNIRVTVVDTASLGGINGLYRIVSVESGEWDVNQGANYYGQDEDGLYLYGYEGFGAISMPKGHLTPASQESILFKGMYFNNVNELLRLFQEAMVGFFPSIVDSAKQTILDFPMVVLQYPLKQGTTWTLMHTPESLRIGKVVMGKEEVTVPAGTFECVKVQWLYDLDDDGEWDADFFIEDYIGEVGLVQRVATILGMTVMNEYGERMRYMDRLDRFTLEAVSLEE